MKNNKFLFISIGICLMAFFLLIAYWTVLPRYGTVDIPGEGIYTGQLRGMTFHGYGIYKSYAVGGTSYEGEWKDGKFHGEGTLAFYNGYQLAGDFVEGSIQGKGTMIFSEGNAREVDFNEILHSGNYTDCDHEH